MNIVEQEAIKFIQRGFYNKGTSISSLNSLLSDKIYDFTRDKDKLDFLKTLREKTLEDKKEHAKN